jgi:hypothetical protein
MREAMGVSGRPQSRRSRRASQSPTPYSTSSSVRSTVRVDELKKVLGGAPLQQAPPSRGEQERQEAEGDETGSESMVSYEGSDLSLTPSANAAGIPQGVATADQADEFDDGDEGTGGLRSDAITEGTITPRPLTATSTVLHKKPSTDNLRRKSSISSQQHDDIPPVPPLPESLRSPTHSESHSLLPDRNASVASKKAQSLRSMGSFRERDRPRTSHSVTSRNNRYSTMTTSSKMWNARDLLDDIDADAPGALGIGSRGVGISGGKPPY